MCLDLHRIDLAKFQFFFRKTRLTFQFPLLREPAFRDEFTVFSVQQEVIAVYRHSDMFDHAKPRRPRRSVKRKEALSFSSFKAEYCST